MPQDLELLAPAGDWTALEAALDAGADAVYLGLRTLNARRRAKNFSPDEFVKAVEAVHARGAKAYLTLNIDLAQREIGQAARILELARQSHADAVLVRDPALMALRPEYPEIEFHMSTQTCMTNSADVSARPRRRKPRGPGPRNDLGRNRRRSKVPGIKTEVFVQAHSAFPSPAAAYCQVGPAAAAETAALHQPLPCALEHKGWAIDCQFNVNEEPADTPLSMKDLSLINRLPDLRQAGVAALKIEGRLKNAAWVSLAVNLFKRALAEKKGTGPLSEKGPVPFFSEEAEQLGHIPAARSPPHISMPSETI